MTTDLTVETERDQRDVRRRKVRALLAGGLVLGLGAAVTLAVWTDNVFGQATFTAENWNVQGDFSVDGSGQWAEYATEADPGTFVYTADFDAMYPGLTVYAPVALRVATGEEAGGDYGATVTLSGGEATPAADTALFDALRYTVVSGVSAAACTQENLAGGTALVPENTFLENGSVGSANVTLAENGDPTSLCFAVTLPEGVDASTVAGVSTGPVTWQFTAVAVV